MRKAIGAATITLHVTQLRAPPSEPTQDPIDDAGRAEPVVHVNIDQTITGGLKGTTERRCCDNRRREHTDWLFGHVSGRTKLYAGPGAAAAVVGEYGDEFLGKGTLPFCFSLLVSLFLFLLWPAPSNSRGWPDEDLLVSYVVNLDGGRGWKATQVWGFQTAKDGKRHYARNIVVTKGEGSKQERVAVQLVYDFVGERDDDKKEEEEEEDDDLTY